MQRHVFEVVSGGTKTHHPVGGEDWSVIIAAKTPQEACYLAWINTDQGKARIVYDWGPDVRPKAQSMSMILRGPFKSEAGWNCGWKAYHCDENGDVVESKSDST